MHSAPVESYSQWPVERHAGAIIVAAGQSTRMAGADKVFLTVLGVPLIAHTLLAFEAATSVESVVLVVSASNLERAKALVLERRFAKVSQVCVGGRRRQDSVRIGLERLGPCPWVVVHDGARPCVLPELIEAGLDEALRWGSAVAAIPVNDTIKAIGRRGEVTETLDRSRLRAVQTPQIFPSDVLRRAYAQSDSPATDDALLVERLGYPVHTYPGSYANIKVTTPDDAHMAEAVLRLRRT